MLIRQTALRVVLLVVLITAVFALNTQKVFPRANSDIPRPAERENWARLEIYDPPQPIGQYIAATEVVPYSKVAFQTSRDSHDWEIYKSNDNGSGQIALTANNPHDIHPRFNRGATRIVFSRRIDGNYEIHTMNADGTGVTRITNNSVDDGNPYWSPNGTRIVFESYRDGQAEIYVMNADGSNQTRLTNHSGFDGFPTWSPDGSKIAFTSRRNGVYRIYVMNVDGSNQSQLSDQPYSFHPAWSPDGTRIAFDADADNDGWQEMWLMNADGSNESLLYDPDGTNDAWVRSWSPDGHYISYTEIHFVLYQGNYYWSTARLRGRGATPNSIYFSMGTHHTDWYPDWQTIDAQPPNSSVADLPVKSPASFVVAWAGADIGETGLKNYDIQVKVGNGPWTDWLLGITATSATYSGSGGQIYYFRSRARDNAYNVEPWPTIHDAVTTIENNPPNSSIDILPTYVRNEGGIFVTWGGTDPGHSGIATYDIQYRIGNGNWISWLSDTDLTSAILQGIDSGQTYYFRSRATDNAYNIENWPNGDGDAQTTIYTWGARGLIYDNTHTPIENAVATTDPLALATLPSNREGEYGVFVANNASSYTIAWDKAGYKPLPSTDFLAHQDAHMNITLPPANNIIANGDFETGALSPEWLTDETISITDANLHTGNHAALMGSQPGFSLPISLSVGGPVYDAQMFIDQNGNTHVVWKQDNTLFHKQRSVSSQWSSTQTVSPISNHASFVAVLGKDNTIHVVWTAKELMYSRLIPNGTWSPPESIPNSLYGYEPHVSVDVIGTVHIVWVDSDDNNVYYSQRQYNSLWITPEQVSHTSIVTEDPWVFSDQFHQVHVLWYQDINLGNDIFYAQRKNNHWTPPKNMFDLPEPERAFGILGAVLDTSGQLHVVLEGGSINNYGLYYFRRGPFTSWSLPYRISQEIPDELDFIVTDDGVLHLVYVTPDGIKYMRRSQNSIWSQVQPIYSNQSFFYNLDVASDGDRNIFLSWNTYSSTTGDVYFAYQKPDGTWAQPHNLSAGVSDVAYFPRLAIGPNLDTQILWIGEKNNHYSIYFSGLESSDTTSSSTLSQIVSLPMTLTHPILSFMYQAGGLHPDGETNLEILIDDGNVMTPMLDLQKSSANWKHEWIDLSTWAGQTVTVTFALHQAVGAPIAWSYLDEITLGSAYPDLWVEVSDTAVFPGDLVVHELTYGNQSGAASGDVVLTYTLPADIAFVNASVPPTAVNASTLTWNLNALPATSDPSTILIIGIVSAAAEPLTHLISTAEIMTTSELEIFNNTAQGSTFTGRFSYLPIIARN